MNLFKSETPERVSIPKEEYIKNQIELENLKYRWFTVQKYVAQHKVLDRNVIGSLLGIPESIMKGEK